MKLIPNSGRGALARFALGAVIVIGFTATTTAVAGLLQFKQFATDLSITPALKHAQVTIPNPGEPQTILIIGSDHRAGTSYNSANTDTMMLVRLDPASSTINVLSIPRDLRVEIPGYGTAKLNGAYADGGPNLLEAVIRQNVFPAFHPNHIVDVNFGGFEALVNAIGCVYTDVDHRYYNNTAVTDYSSIDLQAGYQKLCGPDALSFVRFRHTDNDIVRSARQQDFVRWAKDQYGAANLIDNRDKLLKIFGRHTQTDSNLHTVDGLINLFNLVAFSAGHQIKSIPFPAILLPCAPVVATAGGNAVQTPCYVSADAGAEEHAYHEFMTPTVAAATGPAPTKAVRHRPVRSVNAAGLSADSGDGKQQVAALGDLGMPIYYPRLIANAAQYCSGVTGNCDDQPNPASQYAGAYPRAYHIHDQHGSPYVAYRMTVVLNAELGQYYGVQGTTWQNPPILNSPTEVRTVGSKRLALYYSGHKLGLVAWHTAQGVYWVSNTLTDELSNQQLLAIAASLTRG